MSRCTSLIINRQSPVHHQKESLILLSLCFPGQISSPLFPAWQQRAPPAKNSHFPKHHNMVSSPLKTCFPPLKLLGLEGL